MKESHSGFAAFKRFLMTAAAGTAMIAVVGSIVAVNLLRPYDRPEYAEVDTSESAFLIPLEGDADSQTAFPSVDFLEKRKVAAKRVQIPHRWSQTGRLPTHGEWLPTVRLVKVDRRPVTREWTRSPVSGTAAKDQAVSCESRDSVNFTLGIACTANIPEELAAVYLYTYPSRSLSEMMDSEVRARVQQVVSEETARYDLTQLVGKKNEVIKAVRDDVVPFFEKRGIRISTVGILGGLSFENPEIQKAIDDAVKTSQLKVTAEARREAQEVENRTLRLEAEGRAEAAKLRATAESEAEALKATALAKGKLAAAEAEAEAIRKLADARGYEAERAASVSDVYLRLRAVEAEGERWKRWDGRFPATWAPGGIGGLNPFQVLFPPTASEVNTGLAKSGETSRR
jgi:regulator of protease activity HflC (stomatin/prohibitin superfamily)